MWSIGAIGNISLYPSDSYKIKMYQDNFIIGKKFKIKNFINGNDEILKNKNKNNLLFMSDIVTDNLFLNKK
jgi:hypothetical protein